MKDFENFTDFDDDDGEVYYPPIGYSEKTVDGVLFSVEECTDCGIRILAVYANKKQLGELKKEEFILKLIENGIITLSDDDLPQAEFTSFFSEQDDAELYELDLILADEDYVYATCNLDLKYE